MKMASFLPQTSLLTPIFQPPPLVANMICYVLRCLQFDEALGRGCLFAFSSVPQIFSPCPLTGTQQETFYKPSPATKIAISALEEGKKGQLNFGEHFAP